MFLVTARHRAVSEAHPLWPLAPTAILQLMLPHPVIPVTIGLVQVPPIERASPFQTISTGSSPLGCSSSHPVRQDSNLFMIFLFFQG